VVIELNGDVQLFCRGGPHQSLIVSQHRQWIPVIMCVSPVRFFCGAYEEHLDDFARGQTKSSDKKR